MTYYDYEFSRLGELPADMQITNELGQTRWMTIKPEQIKEILKILNKSEDA